MKQYMTFPKKSFREKFIGDKAFYKMILTIAIPIMVQNGISNFVSMLDNIMVGRVGTEAMSGVSIANQLIFVYFLCMFGGLGGVGIFTAQYYGNNDQEGIRSTFRYKFWLGLILTVLATLVMSLFGDQLIKVYLTEDGSDVDTALTMKNGISYLRIIMLSFPAFFFLNVYGSMLRECGETVLPMKAGIIAVLVNLVFNWLLIFGKLGFPELGSDGAAIATVLSRYVEAGIIMIWTHTHKKKNPWVVGLYRTLKVPKENIKKYFVKGMPILANEALWSFGMATLTQCYSTRGLNVIVAINIANTINNCLNIIFMAMGNAVAIVVGQSLGAGRLKEAKDQDNKMVAFSIAFSLVTSLLLVAAAWIFPEIYNTSEEAKHLATMFILGYAIFTPQNAFMHCAYFTLRSGGKTFITFLFDSVSIWCLSIPTALLLSRLTSVSALTIYFCVNIADWAKLAIGYIMVKRNSWVQNIVQ